MFHRTSALVALCNFLIGIHGQDALFNAEDIDLAHQNGNATIPKLGQAVGLKSGAGSCSGFETKTYAYCDQPAGSMWCWAAAATEIATHYVYPNFWCNKMCKLVGNKIGQNCCGRRVSKACWSQDGTGFDVANAINWATGRQVRYYYYQGALTENYLQHYLQFGPMVLFVQWYCNKPPCGGHFITLMGCFHRRGGITSYYVHDVGNNRGNYHVVGSYNQLRTYVFPTDPQSSGRWTGTLYRVALGSPNILNETVIVV